jgi:hypothetical protein
MVEVLGMELDLIVDRVRLVSPKAKQASKQVLFECFD